MPEIKKKSEKKPDEMAKKKPLTEAQKKEVEITPLKDWRIFFPPEYDIKLEKDKKKKVPAMFLPGLQTEKVIKKGA